MVDILPAFMRCVIILNTLILTCVCGETCNCCASGVCSNELNAHPKGLTMVERVLQNETSQVRPLSEQGFPTEVICDIFVNTFDTLSVADMDYKVNIYMRQSWDDPGLAFHKLFPNISQLSVDSKLLDKLWTPDLFFPNEKESHFHSVTVPNRLIHIKSDGNIYYSARYTLLLTCEMDLFKFPFDTQECTLEVESYGYTDGEIDLIWRNDTPVQLHEHIGDLPQFELIKNETSYCKKFYTTGNFTCLKVTFTMKRNAMFYIITTYIPSTMIVCLSWLSFWINIDAVPARVAMGIITVLTLFTQSSGIWMSLPTVSYVKAIDVWMSTCVVFVFAAMLEFALVNTYARKEIRLLSLKPKEQLSKNITTSMSKTPTVKQMADEYTYGSPKSFDQSSRIVARTFDKTSRILFPSVFLVFNIVYWIYYLIKV